MRRPPSIHRLTKADNGGSGELLGMNLLMKGGLCLLALAFAASTYAADLVVLKPHTFDPPAAHTR